MPQHQEHVEDPKGRCVDGEKVDGHEILGMIVEERPPSLGRWLSMSDHVFGDRGLSDLDAEHLELPVHARRAPEGIFSREPANEGALRAALVESGVALEINNASFDSTRRGSHETCAKIAAEVARLIDLFDNATANGVPGLEMVHDGGAFESGEHRQRGDAFDRRGNSLAAFTFLFEAEKFPHEVAVQVIVAPGSCLSREIYVCQTGGKLWISFRLPGAVVTCDPGVVPEMTAGNDFCAAVVSAEVLYRDDG